MSGGHKKRKKKDAAGYAESQADTGRTWRPFQDSIPHNAAYYDPKTTQLQQWYTTAKAERDAAAPGSPAYYKAEGRMRWTDASKIGRAHV